MSDTPTNLSTPATAADLTTGDLYLAIINHDLNATINAAADRYEQKSVAFSCGNGACQIRSFP